MGDLLVLPECVEEMLSRICLEKQLEPPDAIARRKLAEVGEETALDIVCKIYYSNQTIRTNLSRYINWFVSSPQSPLRENRSLPPSPSSSPNTPAQTPSPLLQGYSPLRRALLSPSAAPSSKSGENSCSQSPKNHAQIGRPKTPIQKPLFSSVPETNESTMPHEISYQTMVLCRELEFRRFFMLRSYIGRIKLEAVISPDQADDIVKMKDLPIHVYESNIWETYGKEFCDPSERIQIVDWDSGKTHFYECKVYQDGSYELKGPCFNTTRTHLQRALGDNNVLIVKFVEGSRAYFDRIFREGIIVGLWRYRFFVFKDESKDGKKKKKGVNKKSPISSSAKSYFVRFDSIAECGECEVYALSTLKVNEARRLFMHAHMVSSIAKYMIRFSLILSKTIKHPIDLSSVVIERIQDIQCRDENDGVILDENGEALILTDGTGYISEDLALLCPLDFGSAKYVNDRDFQKFRNFFENETVPLEGRGTETQNREPPLLMQCRLFSKGCAVKGTLLLNRKLKPGTIQIRPSMLKVERDEKLTIDQTFDSLEIVALSHRPRRNHLSKYLIALLSYGGVPRCFFLDLLTTVLEETKAVFTDKRAALNVAMNNEDMDDASAVTRMIFAGIPLNEPYLQKRLSEMAKSQRNSLKEGKLPISESFYLMGTADPTGKLNTNEVCVILDNGPISGKVLVYRNPGLHFGDIHVLEAVYVEELNDLIGNAKYGIFFSTKGHRSAASEIGNGDFDGDMYWVSRNPQLLEYFSAGEPWNRVLLSPPAVNKKPTDFSPEELEYQLFQLFLEARKPSVDMGFAANSWLTFMDRLLILGDDCAKEKAALRKKMLKLVDLYYDALDAPKSGKKINIPQDLRADLFPHHMGMPKSYNSTSVLGEIYDKVQSFESEDHCIGDIWMLPCFGIEVPQKYVSRWTIRYNDYRSQMAVAMKKDDDESRNRAADEVIKNFKQLLYKAADFEESEKSVEEIYYEALAIYRVTYKYAIEVQKVGLCGFAWKVAGSALLKFYAMSKNEKVVSVSPSVLREIMCKRN